MVSRRARTVVDVVLLFGMAWAWIAIYESFTRSGLWLMLSRMVGGATTLPSELALLSLCLLLGWSCFAGVGWLAWRMARILERSADFPVARARQRAT